MELQDEVKGQAGCMLFFKFYSTRTYKHFLNNVQYDNNVSVSDRILRGPRLLNIFTTNLYLSTT